MLGARAAFRFPRTRSRHENIVRVVPHPAVCPAPARVPAGPDVALAYRLVPRLEEVQEGTARRTVRQGLRQAVTAPRRASRRPAAWAPRRALSRFGPYSKTARVFGQSIPSPQDVLRGLRGGPRRGGARPSHQPPSRLRPIKRPCSGKGSARERREAVVGSVPAPEACALSVSQATTGTPRLFGKRTSRPANQKRDCTNTVQSLFRLLVSAEA